MMAPYAVPATLCFHAFLMYFLVDFSEIVFKLHLTLGKAQDYDTHIHPEALF